MESRQRSWQFPIALGAICIGVMTVLQFRVQALNRSGPPTPRPPTSASVGLDSPAQAGLLPLRGPGVLIRLTDAPHRGGSAQDEAVHDVDLLALVNELWALGAEGVSINQERIVARTAIRCAGPTIMVNAERVGAPFEIRAIGPRAQITTGLRMPGGWVDSMRHLLHRGGEVKIVESTEIVLPAYRGSPTLRYASPGP